MKYFLRNLASIARDYWFKKIDPKTDDPYLQVFYPEIKQSLQSFEHLFYRWIKEEDLSYKLKLVPPFLDLKTGFRLNDSYD